MASCRGRSAAGHDARGDNPQRGFLAVLAFTVTAALLIGSCVHASFGELGGPWTGVVNHTSQTLHFGVYGDRGELFKLAARIDPGRDGELLSPNDLGQYSTFTANGCTFGDIVAFDPLNHEVARHPPPVCGGETWVIEEPPPAAT